MGFRADALPVTCVLVAARIQQQHDVGGASAPQTFGDIADRDRRFLDIAGIGIDRHDVVAIPLTAAVAGEEEPEIIAWFQEFLLEPDPEEAAQSEEHTSAPVTVPSRMPSSA